VTKQPSLPDISEKDQTPLVKILLQHIEQMAVRIHLKDK